MRRPRLATILLLALVGLGVVVDAGPANAAPVRIANGTQFTDTGGNVLHAHGGGVLKVGPFGQYMSRDLTLYNDNGTAYMISAADENFDLQIYRLTPDYLGVSTLVGNFWNDAHREAPALFKRGSTYFMLTSAATGWSPNQARYATAS